MAATLAKSVKNLFYSFPSKYKLISARNCLGIQRFYSSISAVEGNREEFRLEYLDGPQEGKEVNV
jgi:hypothetical protein